MEFLRINSPGRYNSYYGVYGAYWVDSSGNAVTGSDYDNYVYNSYGYFSPGTGGFSGDGSMLIDDNGKIAGGHGFSDIVQGSYGVYLSGL